VASHPPGFGGMPSRRQRCTAATNASAAASSAISRSPKRRATPATTRAHSCLWTRVIASSTVLTSPAASGLHQTPDRLGGLEGTHLHLAAACLRPLSGKFQRHVHVGGIDNPEATDVLLGLQIGTVGDDRLL